MILQTASTIYGAAAAWRRRRYESDPARQRRLSRPVVSVGNLRVGGAGKTPVVEHLARLLRAEGERPAILTRGYARRVQGDGVTVVSDTGRVIASVETAGDEPLMLARALPGVPVLVGADRYLSGRLAETRFGSTVHLLDDGFQHLALARDVDLLLADDADLADSPLPAGRLREPLASASAADAVLVSASDPAIAERVRHTLRVANAFELRRAIGTPHSIAAGAVPIGLSKEEPVFAVAAIARPERFFDDLTAAGWGLAGTMSFPDHHWFTPRDVERIDRAAREASAQAVLTTEKDAVRLKPDPAGHALPVAAVPLTVSIEPAERFRDWLLARLHAARQSPVPTP